jgi:L-cysteine S-thiosulfotransferase
MLRAGVLLPVAVIVAACDGEPSASQRVIGGDPRSGAALIAAYGCTACHQVPGIALATGTVGPSLAGFARRAYIAGRLPNRPMMLTAWLRDPPAIDPETAMPALGLTEPEALDVAAYLYTLR